MFGTQCEDLKVASTQPWLSLQICATIPAFRPLARCPLLPVNGFPFSRIRDRVWQHMPITPACRGLEQEDHLQLKANLSYTVTSRSTTATEEETAKEMLAV